MIPAYNESPSVGAVVRSLQGLYPWVDTYVIDDGSSDDTASQARAAGARVVSLPFHVHGSAAILCGYSLAWTLGYDFLVKIDADGQHNPEDLMRLVEPLVNGEADIVVGSRNLSQLAGKESSLRAGGRVFSSYLISHLVKTVEITDTTSGYRAWNRRCLGILLPLYWGERQLPDDSVLWLTETVLAAGKGIRIAELPIEVLPRAYGKSKSFSLPNMVKYPIRLLLTCFYLASGG